ncbi:hypothetical protein [Streptomyces sp. SGAir0957]
MTVKGTFTINLSGPYDRRAELLEALADASIAAQPTAPAVAGVEEETKGWVQAEFHDGTDSPDSDFQQSCMDRIAVVSSQFGYERRSHGVVLGGAAEFREIVDTRTGEVLMKGWGFPPNAARIYAEEMGMPMEFLELRERPGTWDVPER